MTEETKQFIGDFVEFHKNNLSTKAMSLSVKHHKTVEEKLKESMHIKGQLHILEQLLFTII